MAKTKTNEKLFSLEAKDFYSDFSAEDMLYAALIRSPANTGTISKITIPNMPEGYYFFTAKDIPGKNLFTVNETSISLFTDGAVSFQGESLGIVCGPKKSIVHELAENAEISFDINSLESAVQAIEKKYKQPLIKISEKQNHDDFSELVSEVNDLPSLDEVQSQKKMMRNTVSKVIAEREIKTGVYNTLSVEKAEKKLFTEDVKIISGEWEEKQVDSLWQETYGAFCKMEKDVIHVCTSTKWSYLLIDILKQVLGTTDDKIFLQKTKTSGIYPNGIWKNAKIAAQTAVATYLTKKPVKLIFTQEEQDKFMKPGVNAKVSYKSSVKEDGRIKSMHVKIVCDVGTFNPFAQEIVDRMAISSVGLYMPENLFVEVSAITSSNPPSSVYPKIIDSQSFFALENHIQQIVKETGFLSDEIRLINLSMQHKKFPISLQRDNLPTLLADVIQKSDFNRKFISFKIDATNRIKSPDSTFFALPLRGIGISCSYNGSGYFGKSIFSCDQSMEVTLMADENLIIHTIKPSKVVEEIWKKTVVEILQIDSAKIKINSEFPHDEIPNIPEDTSSNISMMTYLLKKCCLEIQKKRFHEPLPITSKKQISPALKNKWNRENFSGTPFHTTSVCGCVVEVELNPYTYSEKIKGVWLSVDCGEVFDRKAAEHSLKLAIQQELLCLVEDEQVQCENYNISFIESNESPGQLDEIVHNTLPAAFSSALSLALSTEISTLPVSQSLIYNLIKENETKNEKQEQEQQEVKDENSDNAKQQ